MTFLLAELGTNGSLDGQQRLVVKGRFAPKNFEGILRRYVSKFLVIILRYNGVAFQRCEVLGKLSITCQPFPSLSLSPSLPNLPFFPFLLRLML